MDNSSERAASRNLKSLMPAVRMLAPYRVAVIGATLALVLTASVTLSIGMVQLPPVMVSAPFKILLFVLVDGWNLVVGSLVRSFA